MVAPLLFLKRGFQWPTRMKKGDEINYWLLIIISRINYAMTLAATANSIEEEVSDMDLYMLIGR